MKIIFFIAIIIFTFCHTGNSQPAKNETISVLKGGPVTIDGRIEEKEWQDASVYDLSGGGKLFLKHDGEHFYIGVRGIRNGWSQLYLSEGEGRDVYVMHASAALGMSVYQPDKNQLWQPAGEFSWELRDRQITPETQKKMADYLSKYSWVANNNNMNSKNETEFQLKPRSAAGKPFLLAIEYVTGDEKQFFPAALDDDSLKSKLALGFTPPNLKFDHRQWANIVLENRPANGK